MSNIKNRFEQIFDFLCKEDFSTALTLLCPLIDNAGKKLYGIKKTGVRFKKVLNENNSFLYWMMTSNRMILDENADLVFSRKGKDNINLSQSIYKLIRNSLLHEAELSSEIHFTKNGELGPENDRILFPINLLWALVFMLSSLECYINDCPENYDLRISNVKVPLNKLWGNKKEIQKFFNDNIFLRS